MATTIWSILVLPSVGVDTKGGWGEMMMMKRRRRKTDPSNFRGDTRSVFPTGSTSERDHNTVGYRSVTRHRESTCQDSGQQKCFNETNPIHGFPPP